METKFETTASAGQKLGQLKAILYLLQTNLEEFKDEVDRSYELLQIGELTQLTKQIEGSLSNPLSNLSQVSANLDQQVKSLVDMYVKSFLRKNKSLLHAAYRSKTNLNELHYSIVLKDDNLASRNQVFAFLDKYDLIEISAKYPVYFQFVPFELSEKVNFSEQLNFD
jgi:hypothetical protein